MARPPISPSPAPSPLSGSMNRPAPTTPNGRPAGTGERRTLVVGRGISVQGTVQDAERLVVEGTVEAKMITAVELAVAHGGVFKGEAQVEDAEIEGTIDGTLTARGSLIVRSSGRVLGTARCKRLQVEDGGQITGRIEMMTEGGELKSDVAPRPDLARPVVEPAA
jgi:cytoskeletal protein CcmA (bactofilin family)